MAYRPLPSREKDFSARYREVIVRADMAEQAPVRGCMIMKPHGFAVWENIQMVLDRMFKRTGHTNAAFPLLIPKSFFAKEADHVAGFAKECAVVTHSRLTMDPEQGLIVDPDAQLEEELIIRPTSETIIRDAFGRWITSYRDLPIKVNQRANVLRREMRTRMFLRTSEFWRQEGHTAHATDAEAIAEAEQMADVYYDMLTSFGAIYGIRGVKSPAERFAGAEETYTVEPMMQDGKALQVCTSHFLGQNFAKAMDVTYTTSENTTDYPRATSRGLSTRSIGGLIMAHSDERGLVLPPALAPIHVAIVVMQPKDDSDTEALDTYVEQVAEQVRQATMQISSRYYDRPLELTVQIDHDYHETFGTRCTKREERGVPVRLTIGARDMQQGVVEMVIRDQQEKTTIAADQLQTVIVDQLTAMQQRLYETHKQFTLDHLFYATTYDELQQNVQDGFVVASRDGTAETEKAIQEETGITIRCIPDDGFVVGDQNDLGTCIYSGQPATARAVFAKAY